MSASKDILFGRILVTGANGLLGQALVRTLSTAPQYDVLASARDSELFAGGVSCGYTPVDITDYARVRRTFEDFSPGVVVNCAAMTQVDLCETEREDCWRVNVDAVENLASLCRSFGSRFVQLSTDFVFDGDDGPYRETDRPDPVNFYGKSKLASENVSRAAGEDRWSVVRTILVFGQEARLSRSNILLWVAGELGAGRQIRVVTDQFRSPTYNVDLAVGIEQLIRTQATGIFHLSGPETMSVFDFARTVAEELNLDASLIIPTDAGSFVQAARRPPRTGFDIRKAKRVLDYHPRSMVEALQDLSAKLSL